MSSRPGNAAFAATILSTILLSPSNFAAEPAPAATTLDPLVTVATRMPVAASEVIAPLLVIDRETITRSLAADLTDLLRFHAGIDVGRNGGPGQTASVFLRGTESNHVLLLIDGVELNPGTIGAPPLAAIPLSSIERIEVVFGPRSTLYGSEAIGGVINIVTRRGSARPELAVSFVTGSQDTRQWSLSLGRSIDGAHGALDFALDLEGFSTAGYPIQPAVPIDRGDDRRSLTAALGWRGGLWDARLRTFASLGTQEYVDFLGTPVSQAFDDRASSLTVVRDDGRWRSTLLLASFDDEIVQDQANPFTTATDFVRTARDSIDWQNDFGLGRHALTLGAYWSDEDTDAESFGGFDEATRVTAVYAQDRISFGVDDLAVAGRFTDHDTAGTQLSWNAEYGHRFSADWRATANAGAGFRAPDSSDRFAPGFGDPGLAPEHSRHAELALHWTAAPGTTFRLGAFETRIEDLISFGPSFTLENIDDARIRGLEAGWRRVTTTDSWELRALVMDTEDLRSGEPLPRRADRSLTTRYARTLGRLELGADALLSSGTKDSGFSAVHNGGYALLDLSARWALTDRVALRLRLENALDKDYATANGYANPGRSAFLGADLHW